jgi:hypothetical protein
VRRKAGSQRTCRRPEFQVLAGPASWQACVTINAAAAGVPQQLTKRAVGPVLTWRAAYLDSDGTEEIKASIPQWRPPQRLAIHAQRAPTTSGRQICVTYTTQAGMLNDVVTVPVTRLTQPAGSKCVCMHTCTHTCMHAACVHACARVHACAYVCVCAQLRCTHRLCHCACKHATQQGQPAAGTQLGRLSSQLQQDRLMLMSHGCRLGPTLPAR